jgi:hypothetical protein
VRTADRTTCGIRLRHKLLNAQAVLIVQRIPPACAQVSYSIVHSWFSLLRRRSGHRDSATPCKTRWRALSNGGKN